MLRKKKQLNLISLPVIPCEDRCLGAPLTHPEVRPLGGPNTYSEFGGFWKTRVYWTICQNLWKFGRFFWYKSVSFQRERAKYRSEVATPSCFRSKLGICWSGCFGTEFFFIQQKFFAQKMFFPLKKNNSSYYPHLTSIHFNWEKNLASPNLGSIPLAVMFRMSQQKASTFRMCLGNVVARQMPAAVCEIETKKNDLLLSIDILVVYFP